MKEGKLTGFDIDLINALSKEIQLTPAPMPMEFKGLIPALQGKRLDIINSAMYVNPTCSRAGRLRAISENRQPRGGEQR